jgi:hypothetical protein
MNPVLSIVCLSFYNFPLSLRERVGVRVKVVEIPPHPNLLPPGEKGLKVFPPSFSA